MKAIRIDRAPRVDAFPKRADNSNRRCRFLQLKLFISPRVGSVKAGSGRVRSRSIGGGNGGYTAAIRATQLGLTAALIERDKVGGTCLHRGCIPTKAWLESSTFLERVRKASALGVRVDNISLDYPTVVARQKQVVETLHKGLRSTILKHKIEIIEGEGHLLSPTQVAVNGRTLTAKNIVLAPGSQPKDIPGMEVDGARILNSDHLLQLEEIPKSILIVGAGAVGCEFASFYADVGSEVTLVEMMPTVVPLEDEACGHALAKSLAARGINVMTSARVLPDKTRSYDGMVELTVEHENQTKILKGEVVLSAVGRQAVTENLGLDKTAVKTERGWLQVDDSLPHRASQRSRQSAMLSADSSSLTSHRAEGFMARGSDRGQRRPKKSTTTACHVSPTATRRSRPLA